jgi:hypothetical protein
LCWGGGAIAGCQVPSDERRAMSAAARPPLQVRGRQPRAVRAVPGAHAAGHAVCAARGAVGRGCTGWAAAAAAAAPFTPTPTLPLAAALLRAAAPFSSSRAHLAPPPPSRSSSQSLPQSLQCTHRKMHACPQPCCTTSCWLTSLTLTSGGAKGPSPSASSAPWWRSSAHAAPRSWAGSRSRRWAGAGVLQPGGLGGGQLLALQGSGPQAVLK